jgi:hypothetical protein
MESRRWGIICRGSISAGVNDDFAKRRQGACLGVCFISKGLLFEKVVADHHRPSPIFPIVWTVLSVTAVGSSLGWAWFGRVSTRKRQ